jgi:aminoglycoside phosphotransferase (APT) family kinase protein
MPPPRRSASVDTRDTEPVRGDEGLDARALDAYLRPRLPGVAGELEIEQFPGGHSNLTYLLRWRDREYVLRRPPLGPLVPKAHDMGREHRVLEALWPVFPPAPRPWHLCEDPGVIGAPFYVMERRRGVAVLDWEMCTTGDPLADLGTLLGYWTSEGDPYARAEHGGYVSELPGFPTRDEIVARYAARSGRDVARIAFYEVFARYKTAVVVQQIYIRWKRGQTRDARFAQMAPRVEALAQSALALAERSGL